MEVEKVEGLQFEVKEVEVKVKGVWGGGGLDGS